MVNFLSKDPTATTMYINNFDLYKKYFQKFITFHILNFNHIYYTLSNDFRRNLKFETF